MRRYLKNFFFVFLFLVGGVAKTQTLPQLCDSIFKALHYEKFDSLKKFIPTYKELKTTYDSLDMERQVQQIFILQKSMELTLKRSFKSLTKQANNIKMPLGKMEFDNLRHLVQEYEGKKYSNVEIDCHYRNRGGTLYFTAIELNNVWYLGEDLRIMKREVEIEPNYEKIDQKQERRQEKREQAREKNRLKAIQDSIKTEKEQEIAAQKAEQDSLKQLKVAEQEIKKQQQDSIKQEQKKIQAEKKAAQQEEKKRRAEEKAKQKALRAEEKQRKKEEAEQKKQQQKKEAEKDTPPKKE